MNKIFKYGIALPCCSLLLSGCDDGKIYPDDSIDAGRTVTIQVSFTGVRAYPDYNMLTFAAFGEDAHEPLLTQRLSRRRQGRRIHTNGASGRDKSRRHCPRQQRTDIDL